MKVTHADDVEWKRGLEHRGGTFHYRGMMDGEAGTLGNFQINIGRIEGDFTSPRHRHNFDQFRFQMEGDADFGRNGTMTEGCLGYFPEGAFYGPQSAGGTALTAVLQFGSASGSGYLSRGEVEAGRRALKEQGAFKDGLFIRNPDVPGRRQTDGYQAIWEHQHGHEMRYPEPRYRDPVMMDTGHYAWTPLADGVEEKALGVFTERRVEAQMLKLAARARWRGTPRSVYLVLSGQGALGEQGTGASPSYKPHTVIWLAEHDREVMVAAGEETVMLRFGLPDLSGLSQAHEALRTAAE